MTAVFILIPIVILNICLILFSDYAPDIYVFVQYAWKDSLDRTINVDSIINNSALFDLLIILGDFFKFDEPQQWLYLILASVSLVFAIKYYYIVSRSTFLAFLNVYLSGLFFDLNQFRFGASLLFLALFFHANAKIIKNIAILISFVAHVVPPILYFLSVILFRVRYGFIYICTIVLVGILIKDSAGLSDIRLTDYIHNVPFDIPKSLVLILPTIYYLYTYKSTSKFLNNIHKFSVLNVYLCFLFFVFSPLLAARFCEISYLTVNVSNALRRPIVSSFTYIFLFFNIIFVSSRFVNGISHQSAYFIEMYRY